MKKLTFSVLSLILLVACKTESRFSVNTNLAYCRQQVEKSLPYLEKSDMMPRNIVSDTVKNWHCTGIRDWTSGFWPGVLWYTYESSKDANILKEAGRFSEALYPIVNYKADNHDLGFMLYCSLGNGYRLTQNPEYKEIILRGADSLAVLYNPKVGTIDSWPGFNKKMNWHHNTIIDNMLNLEMLYWAAKNGGSPKLAEIATRHAEVTMNNHFREDYSTYHVVAYDTITGKKVAGVTHQGYSDSSMWARGQSWAVYGFTMCYRETKNPDFLKTAQRAAERFFKDIPEDYIPYWDYNDPAIPNVPRDASAAAVVCSALLELSQYVDDVKIKGDYMQKAMKIIESLSSARYQSRDRNNAFLRHVTGHKPNNSEVDVSIIYADYYYIEALVRLKELNETGKLF